MTDTDFNYPFPTSPPDTICDTGVCPSSTPNPSASDFYCGGSLVNSTCPPCSFTDNSGGSGILFLGCEVLGFNGKLGYNGAESSVTIDLTASGDLTGNSTCSPFTDNYGTLHNCYSCSPSPSSSPVSNTYNGSLGNIYTFSIGTFCFRGILIDHQYIEGDNGYRYSVTLGDGRQVLSGVMVVLTDLYGRPPDALQPNLIHILYETDTSIGDDTCSNNNKCNSFGFSELTATKGIPLKDALVKINGKVCQVPITKACLTMDLSRVISIVSDSVRASSTEATVLELITLACEESGYDFYVEIVGYTIVAYPVNNKKSAIPDNDITGGPLFQLLSDLAKANYVVLDREYGQEMTFNKSKKLVIGDKIKYLTIYDDGSIINDPGSLYMEPDINAVNVIGCTPLPSPPPPSPPSP